ncbi:MAG: CpsD/CapB family tyrosine-protein kinase [Oscillospiraceae bacterium]|nr:CpsD/CapB family tyrosine-protein kinase [Oscillospiraceae bacterium]
MGPFGFNVAQKKDQSPSYTLMRRNILNKNSSFFVRESYKSLRTNIRFFQAVEGCRKFCITSSQAGEGKSITLLNLAITFAESGQKVLLIDADLRRPSQARLLIEQASPGLSNVLAGHCTEEDAIRPSTYPNLDMLYSGEIPPNPSELLGSPRMKTMIDRLSEKYDYILIDTPPVGFVSDACLVAKTLDGMIFLVRQNRAEKELLSRCLQQVKNAGVRLMGFVLNGVTGDGTGKYKYNYRYKYKYSYVSNDKATREK